MKHNYLPISKWKYVSSISTKETAKIEQSNLRIYDSNI